MASFKFSLEQVLVYRTQLEDQAKAELGRLQSNMVLEQGRKAGFIAEMHEQELELAKNTTDLGGRWLIDNYIKALRSDIAQSNRKIEALEKQLQEARKKLLLCAKDKMILEKLKEKHEKTYKLEELQKEQREYDEIASIRFQAPSY